MSDDPTIGDIIAGAVAATERPAIVWAGFGDLPALRELASAAYVNARADVPAPDLAYMEAITFGRLAAAHGDRADAHALIYLLSDFGSYWASIGNRERAVHFEAQALFLAEAFAADGDDEAGDMVVAAAEKLSPEVHMEARRIAALGAS